MTLPFSALDLLALAWFLVLVVGYRLLTLIPGVTQRSIRYAVQQQRLKWMQTMVVRDNRVVDTFVLGNFGQGSAFFASTSAIAIGGLTTILGKGDAAREFLQTMPYVAPMPAMLWELKVLFLIAIFVYAFFKFAWAYRMTHYCGIMLGATPLLSAATARACEEHAYRCAVLTDISAEHSASGLRSLYYSIAALGWFFHPLVFMAATAWIIAILARRDYFSRARAVLANEYDLTDLDLKGLSHLSNKAKDKGL